MLSRRGIAKVYAQIYIVGYYAAIKNVFKE